MDSGLNSTQASRGRSRDSPLRGRSLFQSRFFSLAGENNVQAEVEHAEVFEDDAESGPPVDRAEAAAVDGEAADQGHDGPDDEEDEEAGEDERCASLPDAGDEAGPGQN